MRRRTVLGGIALGAVLLTALTLLGVMRAHRTPHAEPPAPDRGPATRTATQPQLEAALLRPADLAGSYSPAPRPSRQAKPQPERCAALLDPDELVRSASAQAVPGAQPTAQASTQQVGPTTLNQLLTTFSGNGAAATLDELRRIGQRCHDFSAVLEDGTSVRVKVEPETTAAPLLSLDGESFTLKLSLTGPSRTLTGYVALGRAGQVLSVLRQVGPAEQTAGRLDPIGLVDLTLRRLTSPGAAK